MDDFLDWYSNLSFDQNSGFLSGSGSLGILAHLIQVAILIFLIIGIFLKYKPLLEKQKLKEEFKDESVVLHLASAVKVFCWVGEGILILSLLFMINFSLVNDFKLGISNVKYSSNPSKVIFENDLNAMIKVKIVGLPSISTNHEYKYSKIKDYADNKGFAGSSTITAKKDEEESSADIFKTSIEIKPGTRNDSLYKIKTIRLVNKQKTFLFYGKRMTNKWKEATIVFEEIIPVKSKTKKELEKLLD